SRPRMGRGVAGMQPSIARAEKLGESLAGRTIGVMHAALLAALVLAELPPLVVIDPGHGGEADGAIGVCGVKEKDVTLAIATEMAAVLRASGRARVVLTR